MPIPNKLFSNINESDLLQFDHFLLMEADPNVHSRVRKGDFNDFVEMRDL